MILAWASPFKYFLHITVNVSYIIYGKVLLQFGQCFVQSSLLLLGGAFLW